VTRPRATLVSSADTPYYHCIGRCVRRAFLCGADLLTGRNFDHRKVLILTRLSLLTEVFAIDLCGYALMSNHYHLVLRLAPDRAKFWTTRDIVARWSKIFTGPEFLHRYRNGEALTELEVANLDTLVAVWRSRLCDLSWFMRCLNEFVARQANAEDNCTGHFWEGRFRSQALLDDAALITAMVYVDLNPVRAGLAQSVSASDFTSGQQRLDEVTQVGGESPQVVRPRLLPFVGALRQGDNDALGYNLLDYLDLVDRTGRCLDSTTRGQIPGTAPALLSLLGLAPGEWVKTVIDLQSEFCLFIGPPQRLRLCAQSRGWRCVRGVGAARRLYLRANE
jgi:hypothetical protein